MTGWGLALAAALGLGSTGAAVCTGVWLRAMSRNRRAEDRARFPQVHYPPSPIDQLLAPAPTLEPTWEPDGSDWQQALAAAGQPEPIDWPELVDQVDQLDQACGPPRRRTVDGWGYARRHPQD